MDLDTLTVEALLPLLPVDEDDRWEFKDASYLEKKNRGEFKKELGKQVSAFANSNGGYLGFGIDTARQPQPCEQSVGNQTMKDWLAAMVEQSVEQPIRDFRVHRVPFAADSKQSIFVIAVKDSPAAPHQAKEERAYYYRIDGHSKPAPHFHLELLRSRVTKSVLRVTNVDYHVVSLNFSSDRRHIVIGFTIVLENVSMQSATTWGVHFGNDERDFRWMRKNDGTHLHDRFCVHGPPSVVLPGERETLVAQLQYDIQGSGAPPHREAEFAVQVLYVRMTPVTQNATGEPFLFGFTEWEWIAKERQRFHRMLRGFGLEF